MRLSTAQSKRDWFILASLVSRDFKLKYRRSVLGVLWSVLNPLLMMIVLASVFTFVFRGSIEPFPVYLILGQTLFTFMSESTSGAMGSIIGSGSLIKKIRIDKLLFPLEKVVFALVNFAISLIAVIIVLVYYHVALTASIFLLPVLLFDVFIFSLGLGLLLAALSVFFRDVMHLWGVVLTAWTYATPLFYSVEILPSWMMNVMKFNPMYYYVTYFREIVMYGNTPGFKENLLCLGCGVISLIIGLLIFRLKQKKFILYI